VSTDLEKIKAVAEWPVLTTLKQLKGLLGLIGYRKRFVKNYGQITKPLTNMLKKDGFVWSPTAMEAFHSLKQASSQL